ncbi:nudix hydrolase 2-like [Silene latifolia]|uniref:nudix hydrolase 2-like n=1 Tax=Silene latifolia TaxID=37657 RepID=UPI003D784371
MLEIDFSLKLSRIVKKFQALDFAGVYANCFLSGILPPAMAYIFKSRGKLSNVYWIPKTICTIPANASHRVGIGAIVLTEKREVLVTRLRGTGIWKVPTGVVNEGEDICVAAVREVKEETGIDAEFIEVVAFR